jgi:hypothetical protein
VYVLGQTLDGIGYRVVLRKLNQDGVEYGSPWPMYVSTETSCYTCSDCLAQDGNGDVYVGFVCLHAQSGYDWRIRKFSRAGVEQSGWDKKIGFAGHDYLKGLAVDGQGFVTVVGYFSVDGGQQGAAKRFQPGGTEVTSGWDKQLASLPRAVAADRTNGTVCVALGSSDILRFDVNGQAAAGWPPAKTSAYGLAFASNGDLLATGEESLAMFTRKISAAGSILWSETLAHDGGFSQGRAVAVAVDGTVYAGGVQAVGGMDEWRILKYSAGGIRQLGAWENKSFGLVANDKLAAIALWKDQYVYAGGYTGETTCCKYDWRIKRYSADGTEDTIHWDKSYDTNSGQGDAMSIVVDAY